jgi:DNA-nicking Smr family endonuclease
MDMVAPKRRARALTPDEVALWREAMRGVVPARIQPATELPATPSQPAPVPAPSPEAAAAPPVPIAVRRQPRPTTQRLDARGPVDLDRGTWRRLRRGQYPIEARLDLHGMTQARAHDALTGFLATSRSMGRRCVLVITGRGALTGGTLRAVVPRWLDEPPNRERILVYAAAQRHHGGDGALYVLLRRGG